MSAITSEGNVKAREISEEMELEISYVHASDVENARRDRHVVIENPISQRKKGERNVRLVSDSQKIIRRVRSNKATSAAKKRKEKDIV